MVSMRLGRPICAPLRLRSFPNVAIKTVSMVVWLIDDGPFSSSQGTSFSSSSFYASFLQAIGGVMSLALCPQAVSQAPHTSDLLRHKLPVMVALPASLSARSFPLTPACPGQYTHRLFLRWMSNMPVWASHSIFCSRLIESVRMIACVVFRCFLVPFLLLC